MDFQPHTEKEQLLERAISVYVGPTAEVGKEPTFLVITKLSFLFSPGPPWSASWKRDKAHERESRTGSETVAHPLPQHRSL